MTKAKVAIIGAGFSGLTLAWALKKKNIQVELFESAARTGGMLGTKQETVLVETAANALLASKNVEQLLSDIGVTPVKSGHVSKKRWIYRGKPKNLPLKKSEMLKIFSNIILSFVTGNLKPKTKESLADWAGRTGGREFSGYLISPAFQGIYGTTADLLSAKLILNSAFGASFKTKKGNLSGSISARGGMQEIVNSLTGYLELKGVVIHRNRPASVKELQNLFSAVVVATSAEKASSLIEDVSPQAAVTLRRIEMLPLSSVTLQFKSKKTLSGFGCLFPKAENFRSLGVLFNSDIFSNRGENSETWIVANTAKPDDEMISDLISDRQRIMGTNENPEFCSINRWPKALPLYGRELEKILSEGDFKNGSISGVRLSESKFPVYLTGNYLGIIGLTKILDYNLRLADRLERELT
jgi:oxygen-dependent protoporphyrinogen oxidase